MDNPNIVFLTNKLLERLLRNRKNTQGDNHEKLENGKLASDDETLSETEQNAEANYISEVNKNKKVFTSEMITSRLKSGKCTWRLVWGIILLYFSIGGFMLKKIFCNKRFSGIVWAFIVGALFMGFSILGVTLMPTNVSWYIYSSVLRIVFGFICLFILNKFLGRSIKDVLSFKNPKLAFISGFGFIFYVAFFIITYKVGYMGTVGLPLGIFWTQIIFQQITTGFYEELNFRSLLLEGYFNGNKDFKNKLFYSLLSFVIFGALHVITDFSLSTFLSTGSFGFVMAVIYMKSKNIILPMILHFVEDVFANLFPYTLFNNLPLFENLFTALWYVNIGMIIYSVIILFIKDKKDL
jgi:membrane protease YdiL (CAAX protease family)